MPTRHRDPPASPRSGSGRGRRSRWRSGTKKKN